MLCFRHTLLHPARRGEEGRSPEEWSVSEFLDALKRAEADAAFTNVEVITKAAQDANSRAAARFLEHKLGPIPIMLFSGTPRKNVQQ